MTRRSPNIAETSWIVKNRHGCADVDEVTALDPHSPAGLAPPAPAAAPLTAPSPLAPPLTPPPPPPAAAPAPPISAPAPPAPPAAAPETQPALAPPTAPLAAPSQHSPLRAPAPAPPVAAPVPTPAAAPGIPTLPPAAPAPAAAAPPGQLPQSTLDALAAPSTGERWGVTPSRRKGRGSSWIQRWLAWRALVLVAGLAITGGAAAWEQYGPVENDDAALPVPQNASPEAWPAAVEPIAAFVERERGLIFDHPVFIEFLSEEEYVAFFGAEWFEPDDETREEYERLSDLYGAAGLAVDVDLLGAESTVRSVGTIGVYVPSEDTIYIRGTELTPAVETVLAHELTHALQEQHFNLVLGGPGDLAARSIIEADALRVERAFMATLAPSEQESAFDDNALDRESVEELSTVPDALIEATSAPYVLGPLLVDTAFERNGNEGVNQLLRVPPTEELLLNPWMFGTAFEDAEPLVQAPDGAVIVEEVQQLSMIDMLAMLDTWLSWTEARGSLDGWNGGGYVSYVRSDGLTCFNVNASFDSDPEAFASAVTSWAAASGSTAVPVVNLDRVSFEACDRGVGAAAPPQQTVPLTIAAYLESSALLGATPDEQPAYRCLARGMIDDPQAGPLLSSPTLTADEEATVDWIRGVEASRCGLAIEHNETAS